MKQLFKIKKMLGDKYHLTIIYSKKLEGFEWELYRQYDDPKVYYSIDNKAIMSSKNNTIDELYKYAKKHREINPHFIISISNIGIATAVFLATLANSIFYNNETLRGIFMGMDVMILLYSLLAHELYRKKLEIKRLEKLENFDKF